MRFALYPYVDAYLVEMIDLWIAAWTKAMPAIDFEARRTWGVDRLVHLRDSGVAITCAMDTTNGQMAGFITLDLATGYIDQLVVAPALWGTGVAEMLMNDAKARAPGALSLEVNQDNTRAVRFYEKHGFDRGAEGTNATSGRKIWHYDWTRA